MEEKIVEYSLMTPPFKMKNFEEMSDKETREHYDWYISEIPIRLELLESAINSFKSFDRVKLDFSRESLLIVWDWYLENVQIVQKSEGTYQDELLNANPITRDFIKREEIPKGWLSIAMDISIYFSECFVKNQKQLNWGLVTKPKSLACVNKPVIVGFKNDMKLDATNLLFVLTRKVLKGDKKRDALINLYDNWFNQI